MRADCVVAGGGPAGSLLSARLALAGAKVVLLEEHLDIGRPVHCSGIVSPATVEASGYPFERCRVLRTALVHPPCGEPLRLDAPEPRAVLLDRADFDRWLWDRAEAAGAEARAGEAYLSHEVAGDGLRVRTKTGTVETGFLVGADGVSSRVAKDAGFPGLPELLPTIGADVPGNLVGDADIRMDVGQAVAPGFFAWAVRGERTTRVQLGTTAPGARGRLEDYMSMLGWKGSVLAWHGATIPVSMRAEIARGRVALVGDAAGMVKPLSGGGLHPILAGVEALGGALLSEGFSPKASEAYSRAVDAGIGAELRRGAALRKAYLKVGDATLDRAFSLFRREDIARTIAESGDIDHPHHLAMALLRKHPEFLTLAPMLAKDLMR